MKRRVVWVLITLMIGFVFAAVGTWRAINLAERNNHALEQIEIEETNSTDISSIHALGRLEPKGTVLKIAAPSGNEGNRLELLFVDEGTKVKKGQLLGRLDTYTRRLASVAQEESRLVMAEAKLAQVRAGNKLGDIEATRATVDSAQHDLETKNRERARAEQLRKTNALSDAELDDVILKYRLAEAALRQAKAKLDSICEVRAVDIAIAEAEVQFAKTSVELAKANLDATQIIAPADGTVLRIHARPGELVPRDGLLEFGQVDLMQAVAEVFEGDIPMISIGDPAKITIDTTGDKLNGKVVDIGHVVARKTVLTNDPVSDTDARIVEVRIELDPTDMPWLTRLSNARIQAWVGTQRTNPLNDARSNYDGVRGNGLQ